MTRLLCMWALGALAACGGTGPDRSFTLTLSAPERTPVARNSPSAGSLFRCEFTIIAQAAGGVAGDYAAWDGASVDVDDGAIFRPRLSWSADEVAAFFGAERISAGAVQSGAARVDSNAEQFPVTYAFRYRLASGEVETASVTIACG